MPKTVEGMFLDVSTGAGIPSAPVELRSAVTTSVLTTTEAFGLSTNPVNTDGTGHFKFTMDLDPGPIYAVATAPAGDKDYRYSLEQMRVGDHWPADIGLLLRAFQDGVLAGSLNQFNVTVSGSINQYTVQTGYALVQGYAWGLESGSYTATIAPNTTQANRRSIVVLRQYIGGPYQGKQVIDILYGPSSLVDPTVRQGTTVGSDVIWEIPLAKLNTALNASVSTIVSDLRTYSQLGMGIFDGGVPVVGSARGIDFFGASFIVTDEGGGVALITPSFGTGASDFKRGNAGTDGVRNAITANTGNITGIGNIGEVEMAHADLTLDPAATYDISVWGCFTVDGGPGASTSWDVDADARCRLDIPWDSTTTDVGRTAGHFQYGSGSSHQVCHMHAVRGVSGVSTLRAYLMINNRIGGGVTAHHRKVVALATSRQ